MKRINKPKLVLGMNRSVPIRSRLQWRMCDEAERTPEQSQEDNSFNWNESIYDIYVPETNE